jgi:carbamoyl-phosphate synthase large subunit
MNSKSINVLFLGGGKRVSFAEIFLETARRLGREITLYTYELSRNIPISQLAEVIIGLRADDPGLAEHLTAIIKEKKIDVIIPLIDPLIDIVATLKSSCLYAPIPDREMCQTFLNKKLAESWFIKNGFRVPTKTQNFPLIARPCLGSASKGIVIIKSEEEYRCFQKRSDQDKYLVQRYIDGEEYTVDAFTSQNGVIKAVGPRLRIEVAGGEVVRSITVRDQNLIELSTNIIAKANLSGCINLQFIKERYDDSYYCMEINTRPGGGCILSIKAGANFPEMILKEFLNQEIPAVNDWTNQLMMCRAHREYYFLCN